MKAKLMALMLAAGLGITGIAITAQAAGTNTTAACKHETLQYFEYFVEAEYYNGRDHLSTYRAGYECSNPSCFYTTLLHNVTKYEPHDYEQIYYQDGKVQSVCLGCHDSYYW